MTKITLYDTTLRDGSQAEEITLSVADKIRITTQLDSLGIDYAEGGWPSSNKTDKEFFQEIKKYHLEYTKIAAFGSTHNAQTTAEKDENLKEILQAQPDAATLFGKAWDLHVTDALRIAPQRNLELVSASCAYLLPKIPEVFFDAEHFFDGYHANREYALAVLQAATQAGVQTLILCDTNGGCLPSQIYEIVSDVRRHFPDSTLGIHAHNDSETAVANTLEAVRAGASHVQGSINGYGERCGNANLCSIIPNLELKYGGEYSCLPEGKLAQLTAVSHFVSEVCNLRPFMRQPFTGRSAFAHKGGIHVSAVLRNPATYEHITPESVGNRQRVLLSDLAGRSNILFMAKKYGYALDKDDPTVMELLARIKDREQLGYEYSTAEASFELLFFRTMGWSRQYFTLSNFTVTDSRREGSEDPFVEATVKVEVGGKVEHTAASGRGQVASLDQALRKALLPFYPTLEQMRLDDFKVRVLPGMTRETGGTGANVRVLIESADTTHRWTTVGVSYDVIHASWEALVDSINYKLFKDDTRKWPQPDPAGEVSQHEQTPS